jgi:hypothetical protein
VHVHDERHDPTHRHHGGPFYHPSRLVDHLLPHDHPGRDFDDQRR